MDVQLGIPTSSLNFLTLINVLEDKQSESFVYNLVKDSGVTLKHAVVYILRSNP